MGSTEGRLRRLEDTIRSALPCPTCGLPPDSLGYIVIVEDGDGHDPDERCQECGRFLWQTIRVVYEGDPEDPGEVSWP